MIGLNSHWAWTICCWSGTSVRDDRWKTSGISRGTILESDPMDALENNLRNAMAELQEETEGIVCICGPFRRKSI